MTVHAYVLSGETHLYRLLRKGEKVVVDGSRPRTLSLKGWGITPDITGPVSCLQWDPDFSALAVGWLKRGLSLWSASENPNGDFIAPV
jgi:hypothetical protein